MSRHAGLQYCGREERLAKLFEEYTRTHDKEILDALIKAHFHIVRFVAGKFINRGETFEDLVQIGIIALIKTISRFDPSRNVKFTTYATTTIVGEIRRHFRDNMWLLKVPRSMKEFSPRVLRAVAELADELGRRPSIAELAEMLEATEEDVQIALQLGSIYECASLEELLDSDSNEHTTLTLNDALSVPDRELDHVVDYSSLFSALETLDEDSREVIFLRYFVDMSQQEVAKKLGISQMTVSRIQHEALKKLREALPAA